MAPLDPKQAADLLRGLKSETERPFFAWYGTTDADLTSWELRTRSVLTKSLGDSDELTQAFGNLPWKAPVKTPGTTSHTAFRSVFDQARGLIDTAIFELEHFPQVTDIAADTGFDPELWQHVARHIAAKDWGTVAREASVFTEDRIRTWTGRPLTEVGEALMTAVFGDKGAYRMGRTESERQGWHRFAMGISMACRNVDTHRQQHRADLQQYAIGVLGATSLLLTQLRHEHGRQGATQIPHARRG